MDSVRFGRALGIGARAAAKTLITAVDAAASPNPSGTTATGATAKGDGTERDQRVAATQQVAKAAAQAIQTTEGLARGSKQLGESVWRPFLRLSGVLWLEFTGVFFGIFAVFAASGAWKLRSELHETATNHDAHMHLLLAGGMALLFAYFCVSSFVRASRKGRAR